MDRRAFLSSAAVAATAGTALAVDRSLPARPEPEDALPAARFAAELERLQARHAEEARLLAERVAGAEIRPLFRVALALRGLERGVRVVDRAEFDRLARSGALPGRAERITTSRFVWDVREDAAKVGLDPAYVVDRFELVPRAISAPFATVPLCYARGGGRVLGNSLDVVVDSIATELAEKVAAAEAAMAEAGRDGTRDCVVEEPEVHLKLDGYMAEFAVSVLAAGIIRPLARPALS